LRPLRSLRLPSESSFYVTFVSFVVIRFFSPAQRRHDLAAEQLERMCHLFVF